MKMIFKLSTVVLAGLVIASCSKDEVQPTETSTNNSSIEQLRSGEYPSVSFSPDIAESDFQDIMTPYESYAGEEEITIVGEFDPLAEIWTVGIEPSTPPSPDRVIYEGGSYGGFLLAFYSYIFSSEAWTDCGQHIHVDPSNWSMSNDC